MPLSKAASKAGWDLPTGIADTFAAEGRLLSPDGTSLPSLRSLPEDAEWLREHMAHRLVRWIYKVTAASGNGLTFEWESLNELHAHIDAAYRVRLGLWRFPIEGQKHLREEEANWPVPEPKKWGYNTAWDNRIDPEVAGERYMQGLVVCVLEEATYAAFYLTRDAKDMAVGLRGLGHSLANTLAYVVQAEDNAAAASAMWADECNRLRRLHGLNGGNS